MNWVIELAAAILLTSITAGLLMLIWILAGKLLDKAGCLDILFKMLKVIQFFWLFPLVFFIMLYGSRKYAWWGGIMFDGTPLIQKFAEGFCILWMAGLVKGLYDYIKANIRLRKIERTAFTCKASLREMFGSICDELHVNRKHVRLKQTYLTSTPFIAGGWKKTVYIPADASYSQETFRIVFTHELMHYRQGVVWLKQLALLTGKIHFFNPLVRRYGDIVENWCEFACDYALCRKLGGFERYWLAIIETLAFKDLRLGNVSYMAKSGSLLVARMERMVKYSDKLPRLRSKAAAVLSVCLMVMISICSVTAMSLGAADLYSGLYSVSLQEYADVATVENTTAEIDDSRQYDDYSVDVMESGLDQEEEIVDGNIYRKCYVEWEADAKGMSVSTEFEVENSTVIAVVGGVSEHVEGEVLLGIIEPDGERRCVCVEDITAYHFELEEMGTYRIFVCNNTEKPTSGFFWLTYEI